MSGSIPEHSALDLSLGEHSESFVQPKMFKIFVCDQVAGPAVSNLVSNDTCQAFITRLPKIKTKKTLKNQLKQNYLTSSAKSFHPPMAEKCWWGRLFISRRILRSVNTVNPSFSQKCSKLLLVTKFPVQLWAISWAITSANDLSPLCSKIVVGDIRINNGIGHWKA